MSHSHPIIQAQQATVSANWYTDLDSFAHHVLIGGANKRVLDVWRTQPNRSYTIYLDRNVREAPDTTQLTNLTLSSITFEEDFRQQMLCHNTCVIMTESFLHAPYVFMRNLADAVYATKSQLFIISAHMGKHGLISFTDDERQMGQARFYNNFHCLSGSEPVWEVQNTFVSGLMDYGYVYDLADRASRWTIYTCEQNGLARIYRLGLEDASIRPVAYVPCTVSENYQYFCHKRSKFYAKPHMAHVGKNITSSDVHELFAYQIDETNRLELSPEEIIRLLKKFPSVGTTPRSAKCPLSMRPILAILELGVPTVSFNPEMFSCWLIDHPEFHSFVLFVLECLLALFATPLSFVLAGCSATALAADHYYNTATSGWIQWLNEKVSERFVETKATINFPTTLKNFFKSKITVPEENYEGTTRSQQMHDASEQATDEAIDTLIKEEDPNTIKAAFDLASAIFDSLKAGAIARGEKLKDIAAVVFFFELTMHIGRPLHLIRNPVPFIREFIHAMAEGGRERVVAYHDLQDYIVMTSQVFLEEIVPFFSSFFGPIGLFYSSVWRIGNLVHEFDEMTDTGLRRQWRLQRKGVAHLALAAISLGAAVASCFLPLSALSIGVIGTVSFLGHWMANYCSAFSDDDLEKLQLEGYEVDENVILSGLSTSEFMKKFHEGLIIGIKRIGNIVYPIYAYVETKGSELLQYIKSFLKPRERRATAVPEHQANSLNIFQDQGPPPPAPNDDSEDESDASSNGSVSGDDEDRVDAFDEVLSRRSKNRDLSHQIDLINVQVGNTVVPAEISALFNHTSTVYNDARVGKNVCVLNFFARSGKTCFFRNLLQNFTTVTRVWTPNQNLAGDWSGAGYASYQPKISMKFLVIDECWAVPDDTLAEMLSNREILSIIFIGDENQIANLSNKDKQISYRDARNSALKNAIIRRNINKSIVPLRRAGFNFTIKGFGFAFSCKLMKVFGSETMIRFASKDFEENQEHQLIHILMHASRQEIEKDGKKTNVSVVNWTEELMKDLTIIFNQCNIVVALTRSDAVALQEKFPHIEVMRVSQLQGTQTHRKFPQAAIFTAKTWNARVPSVDDPFYDQLMSARANVYTCLTRFTQKVYWIGPSSWSEWDTSKMPKELVSSWDPYEEYRKIVSAVQKPHVISTEFKYLVLVNAALSHYYHAHKDFPKTVLDLGADQMRIGKALTYFQTVLGFKCEYTPSYQLINRNDVLILPKSDLIFNDITVSNGNFRDKLRQEFYLKNAQAAKMWCVKGYTDTMSSRDLQGVILHTSYFFNTNSEYYIIADTITFEPSELSIDVFMKDVTQECSTGLEISEGTIGSSDPWFFWPRFPRKEAVEIDIPSFGYSPKTWSDMLDKYQYADYDPNVVVEVVPREGIIHDKDLVKKDVERQEQYQKKRESTKNQASAVPKEKPAMSKSSEKRARLRSKHGNANQLQQVDKMLVAAYKVNDNKLPDVLPVNTNPSTSKFIQKMVSGPSLGEVIPEFEVVIDGKVYLYVWRGSAWVLVRNTSTSSFIAQSAFKLQELLKTKPHVHASIVPKFSHNTKGFMMPTLPKPVVPDAATFKKSNLRAVMLSDKTDFVPLAYKRNPINDEHVVRTRLLATKLPPSKKAVNLLKTFDVAKFYKKLGISDTIHPNDHTTFAQWVAPYASNRKRTFLRSLNKNKPLFEEKTWTGRAMTKADEVLLQLRQYHDPVMKAQRGLINPDPRFLAMWGPVVSTLEKHFRRQLHFDTNHFFASGAHAATVARWLQQRATKKFFSMDFTSMDSSYFKLWMYVIIDIFLWPFRNNVLHRPLQKCLRKIVRIKIVNSEFRGWNPVKLFEFFTNGELATGLNVTLIFNSLTCLTLLFFVEEELVFSLDIMFLGDDHVIAVEVYQANIFYSTYLNVLQEFRFKATGKSSHWSEVEFCSQFVYYTRPFKYEIDVALPTGNHKLSFVQDSILDWCAFRGQKCFNYSTSNPVPLNEYVPQFLKSIANHRSVPYVSELYNECAKEWGVAENISTYYRRKFPNVQFKIQHCVYWELNEKWWHDMQVFRYGSRDRKEQFKWLIPRNYARYDGYDSRMDIGGIRGLPTKTANDNRSLKPTQKKDKSKNKRAVIKPDYRPGVAALEGFLAQLYA